MIILSVEEVREVKELEEFLDQYSFTNDQLEFINMFIGHAKEGFEDKKMFVLSGSPGSGKTFTVSILIKACEILNLKCLTGAFTGKASQVLRDKGVHANTLHSQMYKPIINTSTGKVIGWNKNEEINTDIWFIDEFSMLHEELIEDILSYKKVTIFTGDEKQLPPVGKDTLYLADMIDHTLNEIVRQAKGNPVIKWSNYVRDGKFLKSGIKEISDKGSFMTLDKNKDAKLIDNLKHKCTQMICGTNKTRHMLNKEYRIRKRYKNIVNIGERLVILKNDKDADVFNGQIIEIISLGEKYVDAVGFDIQKVETDIGELRICLDTLSNPDIKYNDKIFESGMTYDDDYVKPIFVNYSYALTVHKLQGSEAKSILLFANDLWFMKYRADDVKKGEDLYLRAVFTGITRAQKHCIVVI